MSTATQPARDIWTISVNKGGTGEYVPCPAGNHPGRICGLFDIGHHDEVRQNFKTKLDEQVSIRKLVLCYELSKKQKDGQPFVMGEKYTWSMSDKSNFFKTVVSVTGKTFASGESFSPRELLGQPVMVNVINTTPTTEGKFYANIKGIAQYPEGMPLPAFTIEPVLWSVLEGTPCPIPDWLPRVYGKTIDALARESAEFRGLSAGQPPSPSAAVNRGPASGAPRQIAYTDACRAVMAKYGLTEGYTTDDAEERIAVVGLAGPEAQVLRDFAVPF